jgi:hypothetical protein
MSRYSRLAAQVRWCVLVLVPLLALSWPAQGVWATDSPVFMLVPDRGVCTIPDPQVAVRSGNLPPGIVIIIQFGWSNVPPEMRYGGRLPRQTVKPDGTIDGWITLKNCSPSMPDGAVMTIYVDEYLGVGNPGVPQTGTHFATATFTVDQSGPRIPGLPNTGGGGKPRPLAPIWLASCLVVLLMVWSRGVRGWNKVARRH